METQPTKGQTYRAPEHTDFLHKTKPGEETPDIITVLMQRALSALFGGTGNNQEGLSSIEFNVFFREWQGKNIQLGALIKT